MANRADVKAGGAFVTLFLKDNLTGPLTKTLNAVGTQLQSAGKKAVAAGAAIGGLGAAILAPIALSIKTFADAGDQLDKMSLRTGVAAGALAELGFAAEQSGTNLETIEKSIRRMQKTIGDAGRELSTAVDAFDTLGLSATELDGMKPEDQFQLIADRIGAIEDPTKKAAAAMEVFGSRTGTALLPMLDGLQDLRQEARDLGLIPTEKAVKDAAKVTDAFNRLKRSISATAFEIGASLADEVLLLANKAKELLVVVGKWIRDNVALIKTIALAGVGLVALGAAIAGVGVSLIVIGTALTSLATIIGFIASPLGLVTAALVAGAVAWAKYTDSGKAAMTAIGDLARKTFGGIADALASGDIMTAGKIAFTGLKLAAIEGLQGIAALVGDSVAGIAVKLASGDISGAWDDSLIHMSNVWEQWSLSVVTTFTNMAKVIVGVWEKTVGFISDKILEIAAMPVFNKLFEFASGVDIRKEVARGRSLGTADPLGEAQRNARGQTAGLATGATDLLDAIEASSRARAGAAAARAAGASGAGLDALDEMATSTRAMLDELLKAAAARRAASAAEKAGLGAVDDGIGGEMAAGKPGAAFATFSAAAAVAAGAVAGVNAVRKAEEQRAEAIREQKAMAAAMKELVGIQSRFTLGFLMRP